MPHKSAYKKLNKNYSSERQGQTNKERFATQKSKHLRNYENCIGKYTSLELGTQRQKRPNSYLFWKSKPRL